jgi:hypothetical protein
LILKQPHPATPFLQQGTVVNDAITQLTKIFSPQNREITENPATTPRVLETVAAAPRVDENNNNNNSSNSNQTPRVATTTTTTTTTTAIDQLQNRLNTNSARNARSNQLRTNPVRLQLITEEVLPHTLGTTIRKAFKNGTLNGKITSYGKEREYYMIEYDDGDSEELRQKTVEKYIVTANSAIDQMKKINKIDITSKNRNSYTHSIDNEQKKTICNAGIR